MDQELVLHGLWQTQYSPLITNSRLPLGESAIAPQRMLEQASSVVRMRASHRDLRDSHLSARL